MEPSPRSRWGARAALALALAGLLAPAEHAAASEPSPEPAAAGGEFDPAFTTRRGRGGFRNYEGRRVRFAPRLQLLQEMGDHPVGLSARRAQFRVRHDLGPRVRAHASVEVAGGGPDWNDLALQLRVHDALRIWFGQFKSGLSRATLQSSRNLLFTDRAMAAKTFAQTNHVVDGTRDFGALPNHGLGRAPGVQVWGDLGNPRGKNLRYYLELSNGHTKNAFGAGIQPTLRLEWHPRGDPGFTSGVLSAGRELRFSLDAAVHLDRGIQTVDLDGDGGLGAADRQDRTIRDLGVSLEVGRASLHAELFDQDADAANPGIRDVESRGGYVEAGWLFVPRRWSAALRWSRVDPDRARAGDRMLQRSVAITRWLAGRKRRVRLEWQRLADELRPARDRNQVLLAVYLEL